MEARYTDDLEVMAGKLKVKWRFIFVATDITDKSDNTNSHAAVNPQNPDKNMSDRVSVKHTPSDIDISELVPKHLQDLYVRTVKGTTPSESTDIAELLFQFQDVFAKGDIDLSLFKGEIKHRIHTGDATPVKHRLRRTPLKFEGEEQKHLQDMLDKGVILPSISDLAACPVLLRKKGWFYQEVKFLGKIVNKDEISIDPKNIDTVQKWPVPRRGKEFKLESEHQDALNNSKKALTTPPVLGYPGPNYASRVLTQAQRKYCITRKELQAIIAFTRQYRPNLITCRWKACINSKLLSKDRRILHTIRIHPKIAGNQVGKHLKELKKRIPGTFMAIGEFGLDVIQGDEDLREQIKVLRVQ
ncbi:unnamed protein product [Mytilus coruscus]|uniref:Uncharacterized protein n=1 Tax=Mytilus coruscus TaxID=42192 RepID=A0A6J8A1X0_MYTCO|nr:unnamed protein product [Mytilus coruscus]